LAADDLMSRHAVEKAVVSVLKDMAATCAEMAESGDVPRFDRPLVHAHIAFDGHRSGELGLLMDPEFAAEIASRMLGMDCGESLLQETVLDAVKELLNVVCGQFLTLRFGDEQSFSLGVPQVFTLSAQACNILLSQSPMMLFQVGSHILPAYVRERHKAA